jgi:hypothetical protein
VRISSRCKFNKLSGSLLDNSISSLRIAKAIILLTCEIGYNQSGLLNSLGIRLHRQNEQPAFGLAASHEGLVVNLDLRERDYRQKFCV